MPTHLDIPEILTNRPEIDEFEMLYKEATPGPWFFRGVIWDYVNPPEFDTVVESDGCGTHSDEATGIDWMMQITSCAEERRSWPGDAGKQITGQTVFVAEPIMSLTHVTKDVCDNEIRIPMACIRFMRKEDAELVRRSRSIIGILVEWVRKLEHTISALWRENRSLKEKLSLYEAEFRQQHDRDDDGEPADA